MNVCVDIEETQRQVVIDAYNRGLRTSCLESQPAPWIVGGLKILEGGKELTVEDIKKINRSS